ncbi:MAG: DUF362 domain-containing protein [Lachnospiraceae bacterium]|nr:DUF362 domain-containing protein [Lachnospiraceae bacterium]
MISKVKEVPELWTRKVSNVYIGTGNGLLKKNIKRAVDALGGFRKFIKPGQSVFLKPNLTATQEAITGGVTDINFVMKLIELIREESEPGHIMVGENTGQGGAMGRYFVSHGWTAMCERYNVELVDFEKDEWGDYPLENAMVLDVVHLPKKLVEADVFITLPVLKNHDTVCVTGAIKNSFGLIPMLDRRELHRLRAVEQSLVDINRVRKPDLSIVDGRIGMEGIAGGSRFDHPRYANRIIAGDDPVAVDVVCAHVMEQNPRVCYLQWCDDYKLGNVNLDYVNICGMSLEEGKVRFMSPGEQFAEMTDDRVHMYDLGACSRCISLTQGIMHRFDDPATIMTPTDIVYGPGEWTAEEKDRHKGCILVGDCIQEKYRGLGTFVPGCPVSEDAIFDALEKEGTLCHKCLGLTREFIARHTDDDISFLRIMANNQTVYKGKDYHGEATDHILLIGHCMREYYFNHKFRTLAEFEDCGITTDFDDLVAFINSHEVTQDMIEEAYRKLRAHYEKEQAEKHEE